MNNREIIANDFFQCFGCVESILDFYPNKMSSKDGAISYEYDIARDKSMLYTNDELIVQGSYALDVFLLLVVKHTYVELKEIPSQHFYRKKGLTKESKRKFGYIFQDFNDINDYLKVMAEIGREYSEIPVLAMETLDGINYLNGDYLPNDLDMKEYASINDEVIEWIHWECGKEHVVSTFKGVQYFVLAKLQDYLNVLSVP